MHYTYCALYFYCDSAGEGPACNARDLGSIPELGKSPGEGKGYPLQYSGLENSTDRGAWWAAFHGVAKELEMTEHTRTHTHTVALDTHSIRLSGVLQTKDD